MTLPPPVCLFDAARRRAYSRPMIELVDIARREEARVARGISEIANESRPFADGFMCRMDAGSWANIACGAGLAGPTTRDEVRAMIDFYESAGIEPRVELCPFADPSLMEHLGAEGFRIKLFENVFFREIHDGESFESPFPAPDALSIKVIDPQDAEEIERYAQAAVPPFLPEGASVQESMLETIRRCARHPRTIAIAALLGGDMVGTGAMEITPEIATLFGLSVRKDQRRRGIQLAMMIWRLREAANRGAGIATISSRPGVATERNARRMGFQLAYTKAVLIRPGEGLAPVIE